MKIKAKSRSCRVKASTMEIAGAWPWPTGHEGRLGGFLVSSPWEGLRWEQGPAAALPSLAAEGLWDELDEILRRAAGNHPPRG